MLDTKETADDLQAAMVDRTRRRLARTGMTLLPAVEQAMLNVPRHLFTDETPLQEVYGDDAVITLRDPRGLAVSSVSAPWLQAAQLTQAEVQAGDHVLEVGSGGYNAALAREIVGPTGSVTSIDIDMLVTARARRCLAAAGYSDVEVLEHDAEFELPGGRVFDKIIVTVGLWDIPAALVSQVAEGGRLVVPLRTMSMTRSWALDRKSDALVSRNNVLCGFVQVRGEGASAGTSVRLQQEPEVGLWCDEAQDIDAEKLAGVLDQPRAEVWSGITIPGATTVSDLDVWLATRLPGFCQITADPRAIEAGTVDLPRPWGMPAFVEGSTLAYRRRNRPVDEQRTRLEFGAIAHGPDSERAAQFLAEQVRAWDGAGRPAPVLTVHPKDTPDVDLPEGFHLQKRHTRLTISWQ
ncbi:methyltransferase, FxLD system [Kineosporia sp. NBRC 101677]|uniref:methyltransferase, FxLD system n=1 Tax=Kineosporia sp. NBRC 101677 TaxID=3032197 RepID=UPI0025527577|nr:methyltransferase, FxLD system [Kineosporia sp. NBRC 101677]